jgi:tetratricopeptide (TPR) repeat protein
MREIRALTRDARQYPEDLAAAMRLAGRQLTMGVAEADPRFVGYARGTLARWWQDETAAPPLRILRARISQAQHDFGAAAVDLRAALRDAPDATQALLLLASIDEVTGDLAEAKASCARFGALKPGLAATACAASIGSLTGEAEASHSALANAVASQPTVDRRERLWALTILGEIAIRRDDPAAEQHLKEVLALDPRDVYALTVFSDYLLDHGRPEEVLWILRDFERIDALYLRLTLAARATGDPRFQTMRDAMSARFEASRKQGDTLHLRDASRFALEVEQDGPRALDFARQNWTVHHTPYDMRALLAAAIACHDRATAQPVIDWVATIGLEDRLIERLIERLDSTG